MLCFFLPKGFNFAPIRTVLSYLPNESYHFKYLQFSLAFDFWLKHFVVFNLRLLIKNIFFG
jgi:hypothetical protein